MSTVPFPIGLDRRESLRGGLLFSLTFHALLVASALGYRLLGFRSGAGWGRQWNTGEATHVGVVASLPGVPLPSPMLATQSTVSTENPGLYQNEPQAPPVTAPEVELPKFQQEVKPERMTRVNKRIQKERPEIPENAVPFGQGGRPLLGYSSVSNAAGEGGLNFGEGGFGERFPWYVDAVRNRVRSNWLPSMISPTLTSAPRVFVVFDIDRDGSVHEAEVTQSSGIPEVDRSALRAVLASNPLGPLPPDYSGNKVTVRFYFDFRRQ